MPQEFTPSGVISSLDDHADSHGWLSQAEVVGGLIASGLALLANAGHMLTDEERELGETYL
jgi:hypothetical protein